MRLRLGLDRTCGVVREDNLTREPARNRGATIAANRDSDLESAVLDCQGRCGGAGADFAHNRFRKADAYARLTYPCRGRQHGSWYRQTRCMIRRLGERMAVLLASSLVGHIRRLTWRHLQRRRRISRTIEFQRAGVNPHRQLLVQQSKQRYQRDPATVAAA